MVLLVSTLVGCSVWFYRLVTTRQWRDLWFPAALVLFVFNIVNHYMLVSGIALAGNMAYGVYKRVKR
jgi:hypothetical protein